MYSCGPTIYNFAHIGNLRSFIVADLLYRTLKYDGYEPRWVMNLTDIDDKTIKGTIEKFGKNAGVKELFNFTEEYKKAFIEDLREVNVLVDEIEFIRVTDKMPQIQEFILLLLQKGYAYKAEDGSTYFSIEKYQQDFGDYGQLVGEKFIEGKKVGARVAVDEYEKDNLSDFALWKAHNPETDGNIYWDHTDLGKGRPGWHIECSVINHAAFKGEPTDIHTGGVDLIFPHHTNEIAQSQALLGKGNFVHHWFHSEHLLVDGKKMSKSLGNFYTLDDLRLKYSKNFKVGSVLRNLFTEVPYNSVQNFTFDVFESASKSLENLEKKVEEKVIEDIDSQNYKQDPALLNNLNVSIARASIWSELKSSQPLTSIIVSSIVGTATAMIGSDIKSKIIREVDFNEDPLPEKVEQLLAERQAARDMKDFQKSDELRLKIAALGYEVKDTSEGQEVKKKKSL